MTDAKIPVTEDELHAYVDNELPPERRGEVEAWLATHPDDAERVQSWRAMAEALHARYDSVADEAVPKRLEIERPGAAPSPSSFHSFTLDALDAHRLYVVEVRHPVEVPGSERAHLQQWLTKRCGWDVRAPELDATGLKLVGGRLLPGPAGPASFLMYESASGERFTLYTSKAKTGTAQMRYTAAENSGSMYWSEDGVGYVLSGPTDKDRLHQVARLVYDQTEKTRS